jgi:hypothetical protein
MARQIEPSRSAKPSIAKRGVAVVVLLAVAYLVIHAVIGIAVAIFWIAAVVAVVVAALWAAKTLF